MENVSFDILNKKIIDLANAVKSMQVQIDALKKSEEIFLREEMNAWDNLSKKTFSDFEIPL